MKDQDLSNNILAAYNHVTPLVKDEKHNIKNVIIKYSMGRPFIINKDYTLEELKPKERIPKKKTIKEKPKKESKEEKK